jgi:hypothetical protein
MQAYRARFISDFDFMDTSRQEYLRLNKLETSGDAVWRPWQPLAGCGSKSRVSAPQVRAGNKRFSRVGEGEIHTLQTGVRKIARFRLEIFATCIGEIAACATS